MSVYVDVYKAAAIRKLQRNKWSMKTKICPAWLSRYKGFIKWY
jgi:hypothetical protein